MCAVNVYTSNRIRLVNAITRAALIKRISQHFPEGSVIPERWEEIPFTTQMVIEVNDPEACSVWKGRGFMTAEVEQAVLNKTWSSEARSPRDFAAEHEAKIQASLAQLDIQGQEALEAQIEARRESEETARQNSLRMVGHG